MSVLNLVRNIIKPSRGKDGTGGPLRLSPEALDAIVSGGRDAHDDSASASPAQLGGTRTCYGTRATVRAALPDSPTVPVMLREISETSLSLLIYGPIPEGEQFWIYIPVEGAPNDCVAIWCVVDECKESGLEGEGYVARASFMEGTPPALPVQAVPPPAAPMRPSINSKLFSPADSSESSPSTSVSSPERSGGAGLFTRSSETASAPVQHETTSEYASLPSRPTADQHTASATQPLPSSQPVPSDHHASTFSEPFSASSNHAMETPEAMESKTDPNDDDSGLDANSKAPLTSRQLRNIAKLIRSQLMNLNRLSQRLDHHAIPDEEALRGDLFNAREAMAQLRKTIQKRRMKAGDRIRRRRRRRMLAAQKSGLLPASQPQMVPTVRTADPMPVRQQQPRQVQAVA